jgi:hypothetical protein
MESKTNPSRPDPSTNAMANAFDEVWGRFVALEGPGADTPDNRGLLAAHIVVLFRTLKADQSQIVTSALTFLLALAAAKRIGRQNLAPPLAPETALGGASSSFGPETINAMAEAMRLCLDELPLQIPSEGHAVLQTTIMSAARAGERDPLRMQAVAMQALKARQ